MKLLKVPQLGVLFLHLQKFKLIFTFIFSLNLLVGPAFNEFAQAKEKKTYQTSQSNQRPVVIVLSLDGFGKNVYLKNLKENIY